MENLIKKHEAFEKAASAQEERFAALERLTTVRYIFPRFPINIFLIISLRLQFELKELKRRQEDDERRRHEEIVRTSGPREDRPDAPSRSETGSMKSGSKFSNKKHIISAFPPKKVFQILHEV